MSLNIFLSEKEVENSGLNLVINNDLVFKSDTILTNSDFEKVVLEEVDKAEYYDKKQVKSLRSKEIYNKNDLSTGCKTLLNIEKHPELCFTVVECGNNAKKFLFDLQDGNILWESITVAINASNKSCDIVLRGIHYTTVSSFLDAVDKIYEENED